MSDATRAHLSDRYRYVRETTERLASSLTAEDQQLQSMADCSPTKWHRAHTTWFFETFVLTPRGFAPVNDRYAFLFNSYYNALGPRHARPRRGVVSRPSVHEIGQYRRVVDKRVLDVIDREPDASDLRAIVELGLAHEEQHQELILTDIHHAFSENPLLPAYRSGEVRHAEPAEPLAFAPFEGGLHEIGALPTDAFTFDNEHPRHRVWVEPFALSTRLATVGEMRAFIDAGGYDTPALWLSAGFDWVREQGIRAPGYATLRDGAYLVFGLHGLREAGDAEPVTHVSFYEAEALARFLGARLPTEAEWEVAAQHASRCGRFLEHGHLHALPATPGEPGVVRQLFGDAWEWTRSSYEPYPGYEAGPGALGEYNGKFMANQFVLRGGSCFTPRAHVRSSYRNFWPANTRFQMTGVRLARSL
ncbi:MAG: ergothioneine biosynthesis protein EgtB [Vicinamibacterales bacterium]